MTGNVKLFNWSLGIVGALIGGVLGYFLFWVVMREGYYAMMLPGALLGLGCGLLSGIRSIVLGIVSGVLALLLGIFIEWKFWPSPADESFTYFITHLHQLKFTTIIMISLGGFFGYWFGLGRAGGVWIRRGQPDFSKGKPYDKP